MPVTPSLLLSFVGAFCCAQEPGTIETVAGSGAAALTQRAGAARQFNLGQPFGVEEGPDGALYVCEVENHRILRLSPDGAEITTVVGDGKKGTRGDGEPAVKAGLDEPYEVRFDADGNLVWVEMRGAVVRRCDRQTGLVTRLVGTGKRGAGGDGGPGVEAQLDSPHSIAIDGRVALYIADPTAHRIRRLDLRTGVIESVAGTGAATMPRDGSVATGNPILGPRALHIRDGVLWIALREGNSVWRMDIGTRRLTHVTGSAQVGFRDGSLSEALFNGPKGIVAAPGGRVFVVDTENQAIRCVDVLARRVFTVAGGGPKRRGFGGDGGPALDAALDRPHGIAVLTSGALAIGDTNNHRVRRVVLAPKR